MKRILLLCVEKDTESTLAAMRDLGAVHLDLSSSGGEEKAAAGSALDKAEKAIRIAAKAAKEFGDGKTGESLGADEILALEARREELKGTAESLKGTIRRYGPFGDFDPVLAKRLESAGVRLVLKDNGAYAFAYGGETLDEEPGVRQIPLPEERLSVTKNRLSDTESEMADITAKIARADVSGIVKAFPELRDAVLFAAAKDEMAANVFGDGDSSSMRFSLVRGWIADDSSETLKEAARKNGWGLVLRDPDADEIPPTLIRPPKMFRPVKALFEGLGIAPAYSEADVSVPFMCYFSLFFAMLVGDGAYGAIFLAATLYGWKKTSGGNRSPLVRSWLVLMTVFSSATVLWGLFSNTWFGAQIPWCADWPTVKWLADPSYSNMMLLCFTIGASHLILARLWNGVCRINDSTCVAEFGWAGILLFMYFVTNSIVGIFSGIPSVLYWMFGVSLAMVFGFSVKPSELKTRGAELGMLPLNIMSALGDIISYVRLFAVGLASVKVAENFNAMAVGLLDGADAIWAKVLMAVAMVAILVLGHALNLVMAGLSILVHAVRLNTLEFSNHKGVSWAGYSFNPFRRSAKA
jgi:V/A-type H+-transporting ATPase subunit I